MRVLVFDILAPHLQSHRKMKPKFKINLTAIKKENGPESPSSVLAPPLESMSIPDDLTLELQPQDIHTLKELGAGNGGTVSLVTHTPTQTIMARKIIHVEAKNSVRRQILRELQILHKCNSPYIVGFYGSFLKDSDIHICMEYMNAGSLDHIYRKTGPVSERVTGKIAHAVLSGLVYLYQAHRIIHRGISNLQRRQAKQHPAQL